MKVTKICVPPPPTTKIIIEFDQEETGTFMNLLGYSKNLSNYVAGLNNLSDAEKNNLRDLLYTLFNKFNQ